MYKVNDTVLYASHGICKIQEIKTMNAGGKQEKYYVLRPEGDQFSTLYVPVDSDAAATKLRSVVTTEQISELIKSIPGQDTEWIDDRNKRRVNFREILRSGDRHALVGLIKTLYERQNAQNEKGKKLGTDDESVMKAAEKMLHNEFAHVLDISAADVADFIERQLDDFDESAEFAK